MDFRNGIRQSVVSCPSCLGPHGFPSLFLLNYRLGHLVIVGVAAGELEAVCVLGGIPIV